MIKQYVTRYNVEKLPVLVAECDVEYGECTDKYNTPGDIAGFLWHGLHLTDDTEERVILLCFDAPGQMIGFFEISRGGMDYSVFDISSIARKALLIGASSVVVAHNHPSGVLTPSSADDKSSERIKEMCKIIGITYNDFIIVGRDRENCNCYYSYNDMKRI